MSRTGVPSTGSRPRTTRACVKPSSPVRPSARSGRSSIRETTSPQPSSTGSVTGDATYPIGSRVMLSSVTRAPRPVGDGARWRPFARVRRREARARKPSRVRHPGLEGILTDDMEPPYDIPESDEDLLAACDVQAFRASGPGGQSVNTSDSAVRMRHPDSGITVVCRTERSQLLNKRICLKRLREKLAAANAPPPAPRRLTRKSHGVRNAELADKAQRARTKRLRRPPSGADE